jgi:hypothetical protein
MASFTPRGKSPRYPLDKRLSGPQSRSACCGVEINPFPLSGIEPWPSSPSLYRLSYPGCWFVTSIHEKISPGLIKSASCFCLPCSRFRRGNQHMYTLKPCCSTFSAPCAWNERINGWSCVYPSVRMFQLGNRWTDFIKFSIGEICINMSCPFNFQSNRTCVPTT